jgi:hypothetical protein
MPIRSGDEWLALCKEENKLQPSLRRHIYRVDNYVVKIDLAADEPDVYGDFHNPRITRLLSENAKAMTELVNQTTTIPIPQFVEDGYLSGFNGANCDFSVWTYIEGCTLEERWDQLTTNQKEKLMERLLGFVRQLEKVENPLKEEFAVGTLCSTHELLNNPGIPGKEERFWRNNGPFKNVEEYAQKGPELYYYIATFPSSTKDVLDQMDWFRCNVLIDEEGERVVGVLDWENAGFSPCPKENFVAGASPEVVKKFYPWLNLFDGFDNRYHLVFGRINGDGSNERL